MGPHHLAHHRDRRDDVVLVDQHSPVDNLYRVAWHDQTARGVTLNEVHTGATPHTGSVNSFASDFALWITRAPVGQSSTALLWGDAYVRLIC